MTKAARTCARNAYARSKLTKKQERIINKERKIKMNKKKESIFKTKREQYNRDKDMDFARADDVMDLGMDLGMADDNLLDHFLEQAMDEYERAR